jgi:hypothetical protein
VIVPAVFPLKDREPQTTFIYAVDDYVAVRVCDLRALRFQVHNLEPGIAHRHLRKYPYIASLDIRDQSKKFRIVFILTQNILARIRDIVARRS